jgi:hypothetical protein
MNYILNNNIDFYAELNKDSDDESSDENTCLLTDLPLDKNSIKLPCSHEFNFYPLYKEVFQQKTLTTSSYLNLDKLDFHQIKCPYCRQKHDFLLPHIRINKDMRYCPGVNSPQQFCMKFHTCDYVFKSGKNKGNMCYSNAYYDVNGCYCLTHHTSIAKKMTTSNKTKTNEGYVKTCGAILKSGKRAGYECGSKIIDETSHFCKRHLSK